MIARAHEDEFESFERWARRIAASDTSFRSRAALEEAAFAPVRGRAGIAGAWIERRGPDPTALAWPSGTVVPPSVTWRRVRLEGIGEVEVARVQGREYVRRIGEVPGGAMLVVTLAFEASEAAPR